MGVARLVYDNYGDRHPFEYVYDPEEIARLFAAGEQHAMVARDKSGVVVGMIGLYRCAPNPRIFELAQLMLLSGQGGRGVASELWRRAMNELPKVIGAVSIFGEAVCTHAFSQRMCEETGMLFSGLVVDAIPAHAYASEEFQGERTSLVLCSKTLVDSPHEVMLPPRYEASYLSYCTDFGLERTLRWPQSRALSKETDFELIEFPVAHSIKILVRSAGADLPQLLADYENRVGDNGVVQVVFNLGEERSAAGIELARANGYSLGGFIPLWFGSDGLLLHKRQKPPMFSTIKTFTEGARKAKKMAQEDYESLRRR